MNTRTVAKRQLAASVDRLGELRVELAALIREEKKLKERIDKAVASGDSFNGKHWSVTKTTKSRAGALDPAKVAAEIGVVEEELGPWRKPMVKVTTLTTTRLAE